LDIKRKAIQVELIATFLPDDVVDGLYKAVEGAGLSVQNLTLEPIAAIQVAIPEMYRMLNIALIDVGAGTSDISITKDGSIVAYGMLPYAGDKITEEIARYCLVDFQTAEKIKISMMSEDEIQYIDIMCLPQIVKRETIYQIIEPTVSAMASETADKIKELNGGKPVSAVFVVGGGGKIYGYTQKVAEVLGIQPERVALRGEEVMRNIQFLDSTIKKDSLLVTPIGICLSFYEQSNNFIHVTLNGKRIKLYDNSKLAVVDAAIGAEFPNEGLFPKRGKELNYSINGKNRLQRGHSGESAIILLNGKAVDIHTSIHSNDVISILESTAGEEAKLEIQQLPEFGDTLKVYVNDQLILLPKFALVNGELQSGYYEIKEGDQIEILNYYTLKQVADFMDLVLESHVSLYVNNKRADLNEKVYENFSIHLKEQSFEEKLVEDNPAQNEHVHVEMNLDSQEKEIVQADGETEISVIVNHRPVFLTGKLYYIFVDIFDYYDFDLSKSQGKAIVTMLNGRSAEYMETLKSGDQIDIYWKES
jgi:cell division ATPase FtsA